MEEDNGAATEINILFLGHECVGKSSIIHRFLCGSFCEKYKPTVEDVYHKRFLINNNLFNVHFLDTSGTYNFPAMRRLNITKANAIVLVFSMSQADSLTVHLSSLLSEINEIVRFSHVKDMGTEESGDKKLIPLVVVGNKMDAIFTQELDQTECRIWMRERHLQEERLVFASAKEDEDVDSIFRCLWNQYLLIHPQLIPSVNIDKGCPNLGELRESVDVVLENPSGKAIEKSPRLPHRKNVSILQCTAHEKRRFSAFAVLSGTAKALDISHVVSKFHPSINQNQRVEAILDREASTPPRLLTVCESSSEASPNEGPSPSHISHRSRHSLQNASTSMQPHKGRLSLGRIFGGIGGSKLLQNEKPCRHDIIRYDCCIQ